MGKPRTHLAAMALDQTLLAVPWAMSRLPVINWVRAFDESLARNTNQTDFDKYQCLTIFTCVSGSPKLKFGCVVSTAPGPKTNPKFSCTHRRSNIHRAQLVRYWELKGVPILPLAMFACSRSPENKACFVWEPHEPNKHSSISVPSTVPYLLLLLRVRIRSDVLVRVVGGVIRAVVLRRRTCETAGAVAVCVASPSSCT